jgi:hypothetical protein
VFVSITFIPFGDVFLFRVAVIASINPNFSASFNLLSVRPVSQIESRLKEAEKLGFIEAITATRNKKTSPNGINVIETNTLRGFISMMQKYRGSAKVSDDGRP